METTNEKIIAQISIAFEIPIGEEFFGAYHFLTKSEQAYWTMYREGFIDMQELRKELAL